MSNGTVMQGKLYQTLGSTGETVSAIGIGGHIGVNGVDEQLSIRIIRTAVDRGIHLMDNSWDYNGGDSEMRMGKALRDGYQERVFLMIKIDGRSKKDMALNEPQPDTLPTRLDQHLRLGGKMALTFCRNANSSAASHQIVRSYVHSH